MPPVTNKPRTVSTTDAIAITGASHRQVYYWISKGVITPTVPPSGQGSRARWSLNDCLVTARVAAISGFVAPTYGVEFAATLAETETAEFDDLLITINFDKIDRRTLRRWQRRVPTV